MSIPQNSIHAQPLSLETIRQYVVTLSWIENGLLTQDVDKIIDFLLESPDSRWFVSQSRRSLALLRYWQERLRFCIRQFEMSIADSRDALDQPAREQIRRSQRQVRMRYVDAEINRNPQHRQLVDSLHHYEQALGVLEGLEGALDTSLLVQEAVSTRREEIEALQTP